MLKKSTLLLSTLGVISLATVHAAQLSACDFTGNCTGYFYSDINAAFVDCVDKNGVLVSRKESFYSSDLQRECHSVAFSAFEASLNATVPMVALPANQTISYCDYFEVGAGYEFSQADNGIGLVFIESIIGGARDLYWKNLVSLPVNLGWDWAELVQLIQALEGAQCSANGTNVTIPSIPDLPDLSGGLADILALLNLDWSQWTLTALENLNVASWTKAEWKFWIQAYVNYWNAIQAFESNLSGAVTSIEQLAESLISEVSGDVSITVSDLEALLVEGSELVIENVNITGVVNFTQFWSPNFDLDNVTIGEILADINIASNVVVQVESWFTAFFINGGLDAFFQNTTLEIEGGNLTTNISTGMPNGNVVVVDVSASVEAVIAWITTNFQTEVQALFPQFNFTFSTGATYVPPMGGNSSSNGTIGGDNSTNSSNGTIGGDNSTNSTNGTIGSGNSSLNGSGSGSAPGGNATLNMSSSSYQFTFENYAVPVGCGYVSGSNSSISCTSGNSRGVTFTFAEINEFWDFSAQQSCSDAQSTLSSCQSNTVITDLNTCLRLSYFNTFQLASDTFIYGWLSYDLVAQSALFGRCQVESSVFSLTESEYSASFTFAFPNLN